MSASAAEAAPAFNLLDWLVVGASLVGMLGLGAWFARRQRDTTEYFLAGRSTPVWAAAIAIVATSVSAATFISAPEDAFNNNLTYLSLNLAGLVAVVIVAIFFVPAFYRHSVTTVYQLLDHRFGVSARRSASGMFLAGRVLASGARLYIAAIPVSLLLFADLDTFHLFCAIALISVIATAYTLLGGLRAVIWTEVPQTLLFIGAAVAAIWLLLAKIPIPVSEIVSALGEAEAGDGSSKLTLFDWRMDPSLPFSMWSALLGLTLFNMAVYGADQDLAQRMLSCRSAIRGGASAILSNLIGFGVALLFLAIGLLLYVYYRRPDLMGAAAPMREIDDSRTVFLDFILVETPAGLRGLMMAGVFAAAMSSLASSLSSMSSALVCDFYRVWRPEREEAHYIRVSRASVLIWGVVLCFFACVCAVWQQATQEGLLPFAIGVMTFAYTGLLGVFLAAIFTHRGTARSAGAALVVGAVAVALMKFGPGSALEGLWPGEEGLPRLSLGWQMFMGTVLAFFVCVAPKSVFKSAKSGENERQGAQEPAHERATGGEARASG